MAPLYCSQMVFIGDLLYLDAHKGAGNVSGCICLSVRAIGFERFDGGSVFLLYGS